jgi:hypothetical protein
MRQARLPDAAEGISAAGLKRRFYIELNDIAGIRGHDSVDFFGADGTGLIGDDLSNPAFVLGFRDFTGHIRAPARGYFSSTFFFKSARPCSNMGPTIVGMANAIHLPMKSSFWPVMRQVTRVSSPDLL